MSTSETEQHIESIPQVGKLAGMAMDGLTSVADEIMKLRTRLLQNDITLFLEDSKGDYQERYSVTINKSSEHDGFDIRIEVITFVPDSLGQDSYMSMCLSIEATVLPKTDSKTLKSIAVVVNRGESNARGIRFRPTANRGTIIIRRDDLLDTERTSILEAAQKALGSFNASKLVNYEVIDKPRSFDSITGGLAEGPPGKLRTLPGGFSEN